MLEATELRPRHQAAIHDGGMVELVGDDEVAAPHQGRDDGQVGDVAGGIGDGGLGMFEGRNGLFEFGMEGQRTGQSPHPVRAGAKFIHGGLGGRVDAWVTN